MTLKNLKLMTGALTTAFALGGAPLAAQDTKPHHESEATRADDRAEGAVERASDAVGDAWLVTKIKAQYFGEDALDDSDIDVDATEGVIVLRGTVVSAAGRARAAEIARKTDGVKRVDNQLTIAMAKKSDDDDAVATKGRAAREGVREDREDAREEAREAREEAREAAQDAKDKARRAADKTARAADRAEDKAGSTMKSAKKETREAVGTSGQAINDGWITTKIKASYFGVDELEGSDIDVDTNDHVVTLTGRVRSKAAKDRAVSIAKKIEGVKHVRDELTIAPR